MSSYLLSISATYFDLILIIKHGVHPTGDLGHLSESYETISLLHYNTFSSSILFLYHLKHVSSDVCCLVFAIYIVYFSDYLSFFMKEK